MNAYIRHRQRKTHSHTHTHTHTHAHTYTHTQPYLDKGQIFMKPKHLAAGIPFYFSRMKETKLGGGGAPFEFNAYF